MRKEVRGEVISEKFDFYLRNQEYWAIIHLDDQEFRSYCVSGEYDFWSFSLGRSD